MKIFIAQLNPIVGALETNRSMIRDAYESGTRAGADVVMVPELAVTGYPPLDLLETVRGSESRSARLAGGHDGLHGPDLRMHRA